MQRIVKNKLNGKRRVAASIATLIVPCAVSNGKAASHPVKVVLDSRGALMHLSAHCEHDADGREFAEGVSRLGETTCLSVREHFLKAATRTNNWREASPVLDAHAVLKVLAEQAYEAARQARREPGRGSARRGKRTPLAELDAAQKNRRVGRALQRWLYRTLRTSKIGKLSDERRGMFLARKPVEIEATTLVSRDDAGNPLYDDSGEIIRRPVLALQLDGRDGKRHVGEIVRVRENGRFDWRVKFDETALRRAVTHGNLFTDDSGECYVCGHDYSFDAAGKRHCTTEKHQAKAAAFVRQIARAFEQRKAA